MGVYCYRIRAKAKVLGDGTKVHLQEFAYRHGRDTEQLHKRYVGPTERAWERMPDEDRANVLVVEGKLEAGAAVFEMAGCRGYRYDDDMRDHYAGFLLQREGKLALVRYARANELVKSRTAFPDMLALLEAGGDYRPSCDESDPETRDIADYYDALQERRGNPKRAYRYGSRLSPDDDGVLESHLAMKVAGLL